ncbi:cupredoxin domain-containing protein [Paenibacillaceae bacterium WGS1546]|uniref:cupredoxin domain-containing protein n=1 Tax=Cohnella sp. WGS1546 TaxID=3366810 RepID=UPI00372D3DF8
MSEIELSILFGILTVWVTGFIFAFRKQLTCMVGMMAAMAMGMSVGLTMGTILTLWLPGLFFQSTVIGMLIGGSIGAIIGGPISVMAVMDGLLSGIMGGMMGTMLMVMMPLPYTLVTVKIISMLFSGVIFILFIMLQSEIKPELLKQRSFLFSKPISMFLVIGLVLGFTQISPLQDSTRFSDDQHHIQLSHDHDHSSQPEANLSEDTELLVQAKEYSFNPGSIHIRLGQKVKITLDNTGQIEHDFEIVGTNIHIHAAPGKKSSLVVSFDRAGYYQVICTLPGHKEAGMTASMQVSK